MKPSAAASPLAVALPLAAALALAAVVLLAPGAPLQAQTAPPSTATGAPAAWRPLIVVDPRAILRARQQHPPAAARKPTPRPRAHATAAPGSEVFERYDTASPRPR